MRPSPVGRMFQRLILMGFVSFDGDNIAQAGINQIFRLLKAVIVYKCLNTLTGVW